jgi:hypothetical protein
MLSISSLKVSQRGKVPLPITKNRHTILLVRTRTMMMRSKKARISKTPVRRTMGNSKMTRVRGKMHLLLKTMITTASILGTT